MTLATIPEFKDATALEQLVLGRLCPRVVNDSAQEIDLRGLMAGHDGVRINLQFTESLSDQALAKQTLDLLPLLFGAAWKVLDLAMELALNFALPQAHHGKVWRIQEKVDQARLGAGQHTVLTIDSAVWRGVCAAYAATFEHRHCLVHRTADFGGAPLQLTGQDKNGTSLQPITLAELQAFIAVAQLVARGIRAGGLENRAANHLRYELDQLQAHTSQTAFGGIKASRPVLVKMALRLLADGTFEADFSLARERATRAMPSSVFDLLIEAPGQPLRTLYARLEEVPQQKVTVNLTALPGYLTWQ